jgi:Uma2 family endonuclease
MSASVSFDPLVELAGMWTTELAERYLPDPGLLPSKYECVDGNLILSPYEAGPNVYAADELRGLFKGPARAVGLRVYTTVNLQMTAQRWIQPDITVMRSPVLSTWAQAADAVVVGEFVSPSSRQRDRLDKPAMCAREGIPYYLRGEVDLRTETATLWFYRLADGEYQEVAVAHTGGSFEITEPFPVAFDPIQLLDL